MDMQIQKKEQKFKGKTLEELKQLDVREFAKLLRSRQRRTVLRNFQSQENFVKRAQAQTTKGKKAVRTHIRDLLIVPELVGMKLQIYNGRDFVPMEVTMDMLGHKLGEFSPTRARAKHKKDDKKKKVGK
ncbi:MAG: ribosomal protein S19 family protein [Nanoarchaeota archaeon]|jgi:small subunit ribosomal protein S19|nr:ribosomal protein S19 family protein [Nanoarchaeota archaeon]